MIGPFFTSLILGVLAVLAYMPRPLQVLLVTALQIPVRVLPRKEWRTFAANLRNVFHLPVDSHFGKMFKNQCIQHQLHCVFEMLRAMHGLRNVRVEGLPELKKLVHAADRSGRGVVFITAHLGAWELCAAYARLAVTRSLAVLAKPPKAAIGKTILTHLRQRMHVDVLWNDDPALLRKMLQQIKNGAALGLVMDQKPDLRRGPEVPFFGLQTPFVGGPATLAARNGSALISIFVVREGFRQFRIIAKELLAPGHNVSDETTITALCAAEIERVIRLYPEQWTWNYKRWKFNSTSMTA